MNVPELTLPDAIRPQFFNHVVGPIAHHIVNITMVRYGETVLDAVASDYIDDLKFFASPIGRNKSVVPNLLDIANLTLRHGDEFALDNPFPISKVQRQAAKQFLLTDTTENFARVIPTGKFGISRPFIFSIENRSVLNALALIVNRTEGLEVNTLDELIAFMQRPELPTVIRGLMAGGHSFDVQLQKYNGFVDARMADFVLKKKPIAFLVNGMLVLNEELKELARHHRKIVASEQEGVFVQHDDIDVDEKYIFNTDEDSRRTNDRVSSGCPIKTLTFKQHTIELDKYGLGLTDEQIALLCSGDRPTAVPKQINGKEQTGVFAIKEDAIARFIEFDITYLEALVERLKADLVAQPVSTIPGGSTLKRNLQRLGVQTDLVLSR